MSSPAPFSLFLLALLLIFPALVVFFVFLFVFVVLLLSLNNRTGFIEDMHMDMGGEWSGYIYITAQSNMEQPNNIIHSVQHILSTRHVTTHYQ